MPLHRVGAGGDVAESGVELGEVLHLDHQVPIPQPLEPEAQLGAGEAPAGNQALVAQMAHVAFHGGDECHVGDAGLGVAMDVVEVHAQGIPSGAASRRPLHSSTSV